MTQTWQLLVLQVVSILNIPFIQLRRAVFIITELDRIQMTGKKKKSIKE